MDGDVFGIVGSTQAGFFRIDRVVAEGGFGVVYQAFHTAFRAPVALKCLKVPETMTPHDREQFLERFREEGEMLFRLSSASPAVVRPLHVDAMTLEGGRFVPFLALEWLEGEPFDVIIRRRSKQGKKPLVIRRLVPLLQPIAHALAQAHTSFTANGVRMAIIHSDIKPDNIFVVLAHGRESVRILDFGIARSKSAASLHAGQSTTGGGVDAFTPRYAAPEQWLPKRFGQTGPWTDVWGLALTMVEALTGEPPIGGNDDLATTMGIALDPVTRPTPRLFGADVPDGVEQAFLRALAVDPRERTQSVEAFWTELEIALEIPLSFRTVVRPVLSSNASILSSPVSSPVSRSLAETQAAVVPGPAPDDSALLSLEALGVTRNEVSGPLPPARNISPAPQPRSNIIPNESKTPSPKPPKPAEPLLVDVDIVAKAAPRSPASKKTQSRPPRPQIAPHELPLAESQPSMDWADLWTRLRWPAQVMLLSLVIIAAELYYPRMTSSALESFGVRPMWAAAAVATVALSWACVRLFFGR